MRSRRDPVQTWWDAARAATGREKVEAVGRLTAQRKLPADARAWLLRHGCDDVDMPEFVAYAVETAGLDAWEAGRRHLRRSPHRDAALTLDSLVQRLRALRRLAAEEPTNELRGHAKAQLARLASGC